jgi:chromosome segregation ATPase
MESEIQWLQERWRTLDRELRRSEERVKKVVAQAEEKDQAIVDLNAEIARHLRIIEELNGRILDRERSAASVEAEKAKQDLKLAEKSGDLDKARGQAAVLEDRLQAAMRERDELSRSVADEKIRSVEITTRSGAIEATNHRLATKVQDLETYIDGRKDKWAGLNNELESRKTRIAELESAIAASARQAEEREAEIESLEQRVVELERLHSKAEGRHEERESSYREVQARLTDQAAEIGRLHATASNRDSGVALTSEVVEQHRTELETLERALANRDEAIRKLETEVGSSKVLNEHMEGRGAEDRKLIGELQRGLAELGFERDQLAREFAEAKSQIGTLDQKLAQTEAGAEEIRSESARQQTQISDLEAELAKRKEVINAFDRHAKRLSALKQNLHSLSEDQGEGEPSDSATTKFFSVSNGKDAGAHEDVGEANGELLPFQRKIVPLDADPKAEAEYALSKPIITIGRAKTSDIRILDSVVSRLHARLTSDKDTTIIEDMGSKNGVLVNSQPIDRAILHHGDVISLGANHDFRYVEVGHATH